MLFYAFWIIACVFALAIGSYLYAMTMNERIKRSLFNVNQNADGKISGKTALHELGEFMNLQSSVKKLSIINLWKF